MIRASRTSGLRLFVQFSLSDDAPRSGVLEYRRMLVTVADGLIGAINDLAVALTTDCLDRSVVG
jgi:hypothetical protein